MTNEDFDSWLVYHLELFPSLSEWASAKSRRATLRGWRKAMGKTDLVDAKQASDNMLAGSPKRPYMEEDHAAAIVGEARRLKTERMKDRPIRYVGGQETFSCQLCRDTGYRFVWHKDTVLAAKNGTLDTVKAKYPAVVRCPCAAGESKQHLQRFDERRHCEFTKRSGRPSDEAEQENLRAWVAERFRVPTFSEFDQFAGANQ